jgi:glycosyltransferase involved in cell wall biosynthesis
LGAQFNDALAPTPVRMPPDPLVSIITPSYNQGPFIRATIESVLAQNYPRLEYIIMDGGSTDETAAIVRDYASRLTWISEKDRGQSHAINKGFQMARGEIVSWLNSDDIILAGAVQTAVQALRDHPNAGAIYGEGYCLDRDGIVTRRFASTEPFNLWKLVYLSDYILQQTVYFRRSVFDEIGWLDEDLHYTMDWDLLIRIGRRRPIEYIPEYLGSIREYPEAKSFAGGAPRIREIRELLRKHTGLRYPPGYIVYALHDYCRIWCAAIERRMPALLAKKLQAPLSLACGYGIDKAARSQGWYPDGWAGPTVKLMVSPPGDQPIILEGEIPAGLEQELTIEVDRLPSSKVLLKPGSFRHAIIVPEAIRDQPVHLCLRASQHVRGAAIGLTGDHRKLAFRLKSVTLGDVQPADLADVSGSKSDQSTTSNWT